MGNIRTEATLVLLELFANRRLRILGFNRTALSLHILKANMINIIIVTLLASFIRRSALFAFTLPRGCCLNLDVLLRRIPHFLRLGPLELSRRGFVFIHLARLQLVLGYGATAHFLLNFGQFRLINRHS